MAQPAIRFYPDGSLWTDDNTALVYMAEYEFRDGIRRMPAGVEKLFLDRLPGAYGCCAFRALAPVVGAVNRYTLFFPGACDWMGDREIGMLMYPAILTSVRDDESDLKHVHVQVKMWRNWTAEIAAELAVNLRQWFVEIGSKGVFGESGIASLSSTMRYSAHDACFEIDAHGSGQETLNTLYLAVLNWGMNCRRPLSMINLAADRSDACFASKCVVPLA
jgi:hypothetical protein